MTKGRVLFVGDAVVSTGFARCTHAVCDDLAASGYEVAILGINYFGDPHDYRYPIYPCRAPYDGGKDAIGIGRLPRLCRKLNPDLVVLLNDPWNIPGYMDYLAEFYDRERKKDPGATPPPILGWIAVDGKNQHGHELNSLRHVVTWTSFADEELKKGGYTGPSSVVPLGVDTSLFYPRDQSSARRALSGGRIPEGSFIVGAVGRNQPRKRLDLTIAYFAEWIRTREIDDAYLYLHVAPTGETGCDLHSLIVYHGLNRDGRLRVLLAEPNIGIGFANEHMPIVYSAMDVLLNTSQGEGWGLPVLEAMACGVPTIVPEWSGLGDWARSAAVTIPCTSTALTAPLNSTPYTIGGVVDRGLTIEALDDMYRGKKHREVHSKLGLGLARSLTWHRTAVEFRRVIEQVLEEDRRAALAEKSANENVPTSEVIDTSDVSFNQGVPV